MTVYRGRILVAGAGADGQGALWGPLPEPDSPKPPESEEMPAAKAPRQFDGPPGNADWRRILARLQDLLLAEDRYENHGRVIQAALLDTVRRRPPKGLLPDLLSLAFPAGTVATYGGHGQAFRPNIPRRHILWAIWLARETAIPIDYLRAPWSRAPKPLRKWFDPLLIGLWAAGNSGQSDRAMLAALIARLSADDPPGLRGQVRANLTAVTLCAFGHSALSAMTTWHGARGSAAAG
jgi:hypothetical protein